MAFGDKIKDWWGSWGDDDYYEDESSFDDDLWADLGIDPDDDPDTWFDDLTTTITPTQEDPYGLWDSGTGGLLADLLGGDDDSWDPPTGTVNPWEDEAGLDIGSWLGDLFGAKDPDADPYGIGAGYDDAFDWGDDTPTVDFEDPDFNWGEFDVDSYLDSLLDPDYGGGTEGDPSDWFIDSGDPATQDYSGVGGGMPSGTGGLPSIADFDQDLMNELAGGASTGSFEDWLQSYLPATEVDQWEDLRDEFGNIDPSLFTGPRSRGPLGGGIGPWLRNFFLGEGGLEGKKEGEGIGGLLGLLGSIFGGRQGQTGDGGLFGGGGLGNLATLWMLNQARKEGSDPRAVIPMGQQAYGMDDVYGGPTPDYRVFNIQPALMPGVAYANVGKPEGMKYGGSVYPSVNPVIPRPPFDPRRHWTPPQPKKQRGYGQAQEGRGGMKDGGLGDVTLAKLEPGEFVVTKKAVDNIGAQNLYKMMKQAEGRG